VLSVGQTMHGWRTQIHLDEYHRVQPNFPGRKVRRSEVGQDKLSTALPPLPSCTAEFLFVDESRAPGYAGRTRTRYTYGPRARAHATEHTPTNGSRSRRDIAGRDDRLTGQPGSGCRRSTPHRYAARHRTSIDPSEFPLSGRLMSNPATRMYCRCLTSTVTSTATGRHAHQCTPR
jgi:hypothetical protein